MSLSYGHYLSSLVAYGSACFLFTLQSFLNHTIMYRNLTKLQLNMDDLYCQNNCYGACS